MVLICTEIISRGFFGQQIKGVHDFITFAIVASIFIQLSSCVRDGKLIPADFLMAGWIKDKPILAHGARGVFNHRHLYHVARVNLAHHRFPEILSC